MPGKKGRGPGGKSRRQRQPGQMGWTFDADRPTFTVPGDPSPGHDIQHGWMVRAYLWSRTVLCPDCTGLIPLSPNWRLSPTLSIRVHPNMQFRLPEFQVVPKAEESPATVKKAIAVCIYCGTTTPKRYIHHEAMATVEGWQGATQPAGTMEGRLGHICYAWVLNFWYPIYRNGQPPIQGKDPLEFLVPGDVLYCGYLERQRAMWGKGLWQEWCETDPLLRDLGLYGGAESEYIAGLAALGFPDGFPDDFTSPPDADEDNDDD